MCNAVRGISELVLFACHLVSSVFTWIFFLFSWAYDFGQLMLTIFFYLVRNLFYRGSNRLYNLIIIFNVEFLN